MTTRTRFVLAALAAAIPLLVIATARPQPATHTVQRGESLPQIATRYGVTTQALLAANSLPDVNSIHAGQQLTLPEGADPVEGTDYIIRRGETLYRISLVTGVSVDALLAANDLAGPNAIYPGMRIVIPDGEVVAAEPLVHTVRLGETVSELALRYAVTVDGIAAANDLADPRRISVGQTLLIPQPGQTARPEPAVTASRHRVQPGETLPGIALRYGVTVGALAAANDLPQTAQITPGIVLSIPSVQAGTTSVIHAASGPGLCPDVAITRSGSGYFVRPVEQYVLTRGFFSTHQAVDLAWDLGSPVKAADGGTVVYAGWNDYGYGNLVVLDHGRGWRTYYAHLRTVSVECGAWAARGSVIGALGSTGNSTGPHLHFELLRFGIAVDPEGYIRF